MERLLKSKRLWFVTGKGGVGKSTLSAAIGRYLADEGAKTLIVEVGPLSVMDAFFDTGPGGGEFERVDSSLFVTNPDQTDCLVGTVAKFLPSRRLVQMLLRNQFIERFLDAAPGINEFAIIDRIVDILKSDDHLFDHIIVDLPASGHAVTFLRVPRMLKRAIQVGSVANAAEDLAEIIEDPERCGVTAVCLPEQMPVNETIELADKMVDSVGRPLDLVFLNMLHREPISASLRELFEDLVEALRQPDGAISYAESTAFEGLMSGNAFALDWYDRDRGHAERLYDSLSVPIVDIPVVYRNTDDQIADGVVERLREEATGSF